MAHPIDNMCMVDGCNRSWDISFETNTEKIRVCEWHTYLVTLKNSGGQKVEVKTKTVINNQMK